MTYPLPKEDQDRAAALAKKMLALAKGESPEVTAMAGKLIIDIVVWVHEANGLQKKNRQAYKPKAATAKGGAV